MTQLSSKVTPVYPTEPVFPLSVEQYHAMIDAGVLTDDDPVELIEGVLVFHMPKNPPHTFVTNAVHETFESLFPRPEWHCRLQDPITLPDSEPEPDVVLARGSRRAYATRHPGAADAAIVVEVADSSLERDRNLKRRTYARAGIHQYWVIDISGRQIEIFTNPSSTENGEMGYSTYAAYREGDVIDIVVDGTRRGQVRVADLLPPV